MVYPIKKKLEKTITYYNHRFVYEVFKGPIPRCFKIDRINSVKCDNRIKNLQLLTHKQNSEKSNNKSIISINIKTVYQISNIRYQMRCDSHKLYLGRYC